MSLPAWAMAPDSGARKPILTGAWAFASPTRTSDVTTTTRTIGMRSRMLFLLATLGPTAALPAKMVDDAVRPLACQGRQQSACRGEDSRAPGQEQLFMIRSLPKRIRQPWEDTIMGQGFALFAGTAPEVIRATAREAEGLGYTSFWVNHPGATDGLAALALAARETRRIEVGIGVIPLHTREARSIVDGVRAQALPLDRLLLGVGSPNPDALKRVRAGVAELRSQLATEIVVAALGPQMCRLAGEVADGVLFNWLTPEHARRSADLVRAGAASAKRPVPKLYAYVRVALGPAALEKLGEEGARYAAIPAYGANFERMGMKPVETAIAAQTADAIPRALAAWRGAVDEVVMRAITAKDTVEENLMLVRTSKPA